MSFLGIPFHLVNLIEFATFQPFNSLCQNDIRLFGPTQMSLLGILLHFVNLIDS